MIYTLHAPDGPDGFLASIEAGQTSIQSPADDARFDMLTAIPDGTAKWALIFPPFWLAWHRLWGALIIYAAVVLVLLSLLNTGFAVAVLVLGGLPGLYLFLEGNSLRRDFMARAGWQSLGVVEAANEEEAIMRFVADWPSKVQQLNILETKGSAQTPKMDVAMSSRSDDRLAFGLFPDGVD